MSRRNGFTLLEVALVVAPTATWAAVAARALETRFDLYSKRADGGSAASLTAVRARDDGVRANDGRFIGRATEY